MDMATNLRFKELAAVVQSHLSKITSPGPEIEPKNVGSTHAVSEAVDELQLLLRGPVPYLMDMVIHQARSSYDPIPGSQTNKPFTTML